MATPLGDIGVLEPALLAIQNMFGTIKYLIGGVFGIYVLLLIWRIIDTRLTNQMLKKLLEEQKETNHLLRRIEHSHDIKVRQK
ncbi:MAG: hypothetical protein ABIG89_01670 [Candidatus Woesearchaeota archaeon]